MVLIEFGYSSLIMFVEAGLTVDADLSLVVIFAFWSLSLFLLTVLTLLAELIVTGAARICDHIRKRGLRRRLETEEELWDEWLGMCALCVETMKSW